MEQSMIEAVRAFLEGAGWPYAHDEGAPILHLHYGGAEGEWPCVLYVLEEEGRVGFFSRLPFAVPPERRRAAMEFMTRANYGLALGCFEMDLEDGDLRFRTSLDTGGAPLTDALLGPLVWLNVATMERYWAELLEAVEG